MNFLFLVCHEEEKQTRERNTLIKLGIFRLNYFNWSLDDQNMCILTGKSVHEESNFRKHPHCKEYVETTIFNAVFFSEIFIHENFKANCNLVIIYNSLCLCPIDICSQLGIFRKTNDIHHL